MLVLVLVTLLGSALVNGQDILDRELIEASECDDIEKSGTAQVVGVAGVPAPPKRDTCVSAGPNAEDAWFKEHICKKWAFKCAEGESDADCKTKNEEACEKVRETWLGKFNTFPFSPIETSNTRGKSNADDIVRILDEPTWFSDDVPRADFSRAASRNPSCAFTREPSWQQEDEFEALEANTEPLPSSCAGATLPAAFKSGYPQTLHGVLLYLLDEAWEEFHPDGSQHDGAAKPIVRKDIRTLNEPDRKRYLTAIAATECLGLTKIWGAIHASSPADMHSGLAFVASHSVFMRIYEMSLQRFGGLGENIGLHFAGWPVDNVLPRWHNGRIRFSAIWGDDYLGPIADQYIGREKLESSSDIFGSTRTPWKTPSPATDGPTLVRSFRNVERRGGFISAQDVWGAMAVDDPAEFACQLERSILHGGQHMVIGGNMGNLLAASWDAAFFHHHNFVDCLWRTWQMQGERSERATKESYPDAPSHWSRHRAQDSAHWSIWTSPKHGEREISHADAWVYRNKGKGSYQCLIPSLLPCSSDVDCGVDASISREEKRLYCSAAGVCAQYIETNGICRNEAGAYLPCRKTTDRCQYSPSNFKKYDTRSTPTEETPEAWFCLPSPALECGKQTSKAACSGDCTWVDADAGVQSCASKVPGFGFGVVEEGAETMQSLGATFNFRAQSFPTSSKKSWTLKDETGLDVTATIKPKRFSRGGSFVDDSKLSLYRNTQGFGVDESGVTASVNCDDNSKGGDTNSQLDRNEAFEISFSQPVVLESLDLSKFGQNDELNIDLYLDGKLIALQAYQTGKIVFGVSSKDDVNECPTKGGKVVCSVDKIYLYGSSAFRTRTTSAVARIEDGKCTSQYGDVGFSLDRLTVSTESLVKEQGGTPSQFKGYCTGAPGGDYDACHAEPTCWISPPASPTNNEVEVISVPPGLCGPKGWRPQITFREGDKLPQQGESARELIAEYVRECPCGAGADTVLVSDKKAASGKKYRPLFDLYRVQDRLGGNDDESRKDAGDAPGDSSAAASALSFLNISTLLALLIAAYLN